MRRYIEVKRQPVRGASWGDGKPRLCTLCGVEKAAGDRRRRKRAVITAYDVMGGSRIPVGYCAEHTPEQLREDDDDDTSE